MALTRLERIGTLYSRVEGLIRSGAMVPEDRPLWWDIYKAFPPIDEPIFNRKVVPKPIRQIFYQEDIIKAKFHKSGLPLGTVNLKDNNNLTNAQKFINLYNQMKSEGDYTDEEELYQKCIETLRSDGIESSNFDNRGDTSNETLSSMFSEASDKKMTAANIKNIFD